MSKFLHFFAPLISRLPEVNIPSKEHTFSRKLGITLTIAMIFSFLTLFPVVYVDRDPFRFFRHTITPSPQINLAILGILPILLAGLTMFSLQGLKITNVDWNNQEDRYLYNGTLKVLSLIFTVVGVLFLLISGIFGQYLLLGDIVSIFIQLGFTGVLIIYLDETLKKGWGFGSGLVVFIGSSALSAITAGLFSVQKINEGLTHSISFKGLIPAFLHWFNEDGLINAISTLFIRYSTNYYYLLEGVNFSILSLLLTVLFVSLVIILESKQPKITFHSENPRESYLTPLVPLFLVTIMLMVIRFVIQVNSYVYGVNGGDFPFLGTYELDPYLVRYVPTGGLIYFLLPPESVIVGILNNPLMTLIRIFSFSYIFLFLFKKITNILLKQMSFDSTSEKTVLIKTQWTSIAGIAVCAEIFNPWGVGLLVVPLTLILIDYYRLFIERESPRFVSFDIGLPRDHIDDIPDKSSVKGHYYWILLVLLCLGMYLIRFTLFTLGIRRDF